MKKAMVSTRISAEDREKLDSLCVSLDRSQAWIISALIRGASVDLLQAISEGGRLSPKRGSGQGRQPLSQEPPEFLDQG